MIESPKRFVIWSVEHDMWWRANEAGYTPRLDEAGVYNQDRARQIRLRANGGSKCNECIIPLECVVITDAGQ